MEPTSDNSLEGRSALVAHHAAANHEHVVGSHGGAVAYLHAIRRRWPVALAIGLVTGGLAGAAVWINLKPSYTAEALLRVLAQPDQLVFQTANTSASNSFAIYKATQQQLIKSDFVFIAALRDPAIARLPTVRAEEDPVAWLGQELNVDYPGDAEIMSVSLTSESGNEAKACVKSVVDTYIREVVDKEWATRNDRLETLDELIEEKKRELAAKHEALKTTVETVGTTDSDALALQQQFAVQQYSQFQSEHTKALFEVRRLRAELAAQQTLLASIKEQPAPAEEIQEFAQTDATYAQLVAQLRLLQSSLSETDDRLQPGVAATLLDRHRGRLDAMTGAIDARLKELREAYNRQRIAEVQAQVDLLQNSLALAEEQERLLAQDVVARRQIVQDFGGSSIDVELRKGDIARIQSLLQQIADERERLRIEANNRPRVEIWQEPEVRRNDDGIRGPTMAAFATLAGFALPFIALAWWDVRSRRVNSQSDVDRGIGLPVIGSVPLIPSGADYWADDLSPRERRWQRALHEAMNGIVAKILTQVSHQQGRTIVVSSAVSREGKTTLAMHLAEALARVGQNTLLVDFDLRHPALHRLFEVPATPGIAEALRHEADVRAGICPTSIPRVSILPAGQWSSSGLGALTNGATEMLFRELRDAYDFVIVDTSPILPVADTRLIVRHADLVLLSVLRDVSRAPNVLEASETAAEFGAARVSAVVTCSPASTYMDYYSTESEADAEAESIVA